MRGLALTMGARATRTAAAARLGSHGAGSRARAVSRRPAAASERLATLLVRLAVMPERMETIPEGEGQCRETPVATRKQV